MRRWIFVLSLAAICAALLALETTAQQKAVAKAKIMPRPPIMVNQQRLTLPDVVVVGRVVGLEPMDVEATPAPGQPNVKYRLAVVQVAEALHGVKKATKMVRIGFIAPGENVNPANPGGIQIQPAIQPRLPIRPFYGNVTLQVGQDGLFLLTKHHKEAFYLVANYNSFVTRQDNPNFESEVNSTKQLCKVLENPVASLKAEDAGQRFLAAAVLITKYRTHPGVAVKQEPIDAAESKLILKALAGGDWTQPRFGNARIPSAMEVFTQLGVTANDGYQLLNVRNQQDITQAMQKWLSENEDKYVIKKLVADPNAKVQPPILEPLPRPIGPNRPIKGGILPVQPPLPAPAPQQLPQLQPGVILPAQPAEAIPVPQPQR